MLCCLRKRRAEHKRAELVERHGEPIYRLARRLVENAAEAEAVTGCTIEALLKNGRAAQVPTGVDALRVTLEHARRHANAHSAGDEIHGGMDELVQVALRTMAREEREALVLHDVEGLSYPEAAYVMDLPLAAFKRRLNRGRLALAQA